MTFNHAIMRRFQALHFSSSISYEAFSYPKMTRDSISEIVLNGLPRHLDSVLEIGCHAGQQTVSLLDLFRQKQISVSRLLLIEPSDVITQVGERVRNEYSDVVSSVSVFKGNLEDFVFAGEKYTLIFAVGTLEYIANADEKILEILDHVSPGGKFIFSRNSTTMGREVLSIAAFSIIMAAGYFLGYNLGLLFLGLALLWLVSNYVLLCIRHGKLLNFLYFVVGLVDNSFLIISRRYGLNQNTALELASNLKGRLHKLKGFVFELWVLEVNRNSK